MGEEGGGALRNAEAGREIEEMGSSDVCELNGTDAT